MIQQPELGKKIADYRKAKGFTQEELVEKCNLSVRTLQRIEAGEVVPRTYTLKLIFEALEINYVNSFNDNKGLISKWIEQFYKSFIDLFNLKTNTMKKITILSIVFSAIGFGLFAINIKSNAQNEVKYDNQIEDERTAVKSTNNEMKLKLNCSAMWIDNNVIFGRDVKFTLDGVRVDFKLMQFNKLTRDFNSVFIKGKITSNKAEVLVPARGLEANMIRYYADNVEKTDGEIILKGNALLTTRSDTLATELIIITPKVSIYDN